MEQLPTYYTLLFNAVTDALFALEHQNYGYAKDILINAQQNAELSYLDSLETGES